MISEQIEKEVLESFLIHASKKMQERERKPRNSSYEIYGKLSEEMYETLIEVHKKNKDKTDLCNELYDVAYQALLGVMSLRDKKDKNII